MENLVNPLASTPEWKEGVKKYKENLLKYQPGPNWSFEFVESGISFNFENGRFDRLMTMEDLQEMVKSVSPIGPKVNIDEVQDVTPSYEWLVENFSDGHPYSYSYDKFTKWIKEQKDTFYYSREKEEFSRWEAFEIASELGYRKVIMENLS